VDHGVGSTDHFLKFLYYTSFLTPHDPYSFLLYLRFYFTVALALFPGFWTEITPDHIHEHVQLSVSAGEPFTFISALPGAHGAVMAGTHGCGVNVPKAADVAVAT
jgi:hypothetical protein